MKKISFILLAVFMTMSSVGGLNRMNSVNADENSRPTQQQLLQLMEAHTYVDEELHMTIPYRLYVPEDYQEKSYPILTFLHGAGERGNNNFSQVGGNAEILYRLLTPANREKYPCIIFAPQCPLVSDDPDLLAPIESGGFRWVEKNWEPGFYFLFDEGNQMIEQSVPSQIVVKIMDELIENYNIDVNRQYITGLSMGGYGTWDFIYRYPERFAAAVPICGGADFTQVERIRDVNIWTFHGTADTVVSFTGAKNLYDALEALNVPNIKVTFYEGVDHGSWFPAYQEPELLDFIFSKKLTPKPDPVPDDSNGQDTTTPSTSNGNTLAIVGGCVAGVIVIAAVTFLLIRKKK